MSSNSKAAEQKAVEITRQQWEWINNHIAPRETSVRVVTAANRLYAFLDFITGKPALETVLEDFIELWNYKIDPANTKLKRKYHHTLANKMFRAIDEQHIFESLDGDGSQLAVREFALTTMERKGFRNTTPIKILHPVPGGKGRVDRDTIYIPPQGPEKSATLRKK